MKFIKAAVLSVFLSVPVISAAMGTEELCNLSAERSVELKHFFNNYPNAFSRFLEETQQSNHDTKLKARIRERAYWVYNRRTMPDEDVQRLAFIRCLIETN